MHDIPSTAAESAAAPTAQPERIVCLGGAATEIVFALGAGDRVVAADRTSTYPPQAAERATLGLYRRIAAEGVIAQKPGLVLASEGTGPPTAIAQLHDVGIAVESVPDAVTIDEALHRVHHVAALLGVPEAGKTLTKRMVTELDAVESRVPVGARPKVLFIYARGGGTLMVSGTHTAMHALIEASGGTPVGAEAEGFQPLTAEAVVAAQPDVILFTTHGLESMGGVPGALQAPGIAATPAGSSGRIVHMDDLLLLGLGPRIGQAASELNELLYLRHTP